MAFQVVSPAIQPLSAITAVGQKFTPKKPIRGQSLSILRDAAAFEHFSREDLQRPLPSPGCDSAQDQLRTSSGPAQARPG